MSLFLYVAGVASLQSHKVTFTVFLSLSLCPSSAFLVLTTFSKTCEGKNIILCTLFKDNKSDLLIYIGLGQQFYTAVLVATCYSRNLVDFYLGL